MHRRSIMLLHTRLRASRYAALKASTSAPSSPALARASARFAGLCICFLLSALACGPAAVAQHLDDSELPTPLSERPVPLRFDNLSIEDGLSMSVGQSVFQDKFGFIWIGTQSGVNRFDGIDIKVYDSTPFDTTSFPDGWVGETDEDQDGTLWFATSGGLAQMDRTTERFKTWRHDPSDPNSIGDDWTWEVEPDRYGRIWVATGAGLDRLDPESGEVIRFRHDSTDASSISSDEVVSIRTDDAGILWLASSNGLNRTDPANPVHFDRFLTDFGGDGVSNYFEDTFEREVDPGIIWATSHTGLVRFDPETDDVEYYPYPFEPFRRRFGATIDIVQDPVNRNVLWIPVYGEGLVRFDVRSKRYIQYRADSDDPTSLTNDMVLGLYADRSGNLWTGTVGGGVDRFNPSSRTVEHVRAGTGRGRGLAGLTVWSMSEAPDGKLWVSTADETGDWRITSLDRETGTGRHYDSDEDSPTSLTGGGFQVRHDRNGTLWVSGGGSAGALHRYDDRSDRFVRYLHDPDDDQSIGSNDIRSLFEDSDGVLWVGRREGLSQMTDRSGRFKNYPADPDGTGMPTRIIAIAEDLEGTLWLGSDSYGLARFDPVTEKIETFRHDIRDTTSLSDDFVNSIVIRSREPGVVWVATAGSGLNRLDVATGKFRLFDESDGLANNSLYAMLEDETGQLWLSSNRGLSRFNPETETVRNYGLEIGLQALEFNLKAAYRSQSGELFFGGINGLNSFYPSQFVENSTPPEVALVDLKIHNQSIGKSGVNSRLNAPLQATDQLVLNYTEKDLTFDFAALHFENPEKNEFAYKLEGYDDDWVMTGHNRTAAFTNLDPGEYTFRVRAANSDGVWNEEGTSIRVTINPPFWATWWFRGLALLGLTSLLYFGYATRVRQIAERNRTLEDEVSRRTAEVEESRARLELTNEQLEQSHTIVEAINQETSFRKLLTTILEEARVIPGVEKATALIRMPDDQFHVRASSGWDVDAMQHIRLNPKQAHQRYVEHSEEVGKNIFIAKNVGDRAGTEEMAEFGKVSSFLVLRVAVEGDVRAYLVFDNLTDDHAFEKGDVALLERLREHIQSAFIKTSILDDLQGTLDNLRSTQDRLIQSEKMASLGQLTAGIAHEIKNPLNFVNNFSEVTTELANDLKEELDKRKADLPEDYVREVESLVENLILNSAKVNEHGKRADGIVQNMLEHSNAGEGQRSATDLNGLLNEYTTLALHGFKAQAPDFDIHVERTFDKDVGQVDIVPQEMGRVFMNLIGNAFDALREHGTTGTDAKITIATSRLSATGSDEGGIEIRVSDNGPGIPEKVKARIFEPFFTTKPTGSGTGLGLSMSYDIVTKGHGGTLEVESEPGKGATFIVRLPA